MSPAWTAPRSRRIAAAVIALALLTTAWIRVGAIEPTLRIRTWRTAHNDRFDVYSVFVESHGGEAIEEIAIEPVSGPVTFEGGTSMKDLPAQWRVTFEVHIAGSDFPAGVVRVVQKGRAPQTYRIELGGGE